MKPSGGIKPTIGGPKIPIIILGPVRWRWPTGGGGRGPIKWKSGSKTRDIPYNPGM